MPLSRRSLLKSLTLGAGVLGAAMVSGAPPLVTAGDVLPAEEELLRATAVTFTASSQAQSVIDRVKDGNVYNEWVTAYSTTQTDAWLKANLGSAQNIGKIRTYIGTGNFARDYDILYSLDDVEYEYVPGCVGLDAGAGVDDTWKEVFCGITAQYIKWIFRNKTRSTATNLGSVGEVQLFNP